MTKEGRPSPLKDTRLFYGSRNSHLKESHEALAFARRLTWWLNGEGFSLGHYQALYIQFTPELPEGAVEPGPLKFTPDDWWFRDVAVGVPREFPGGDADAIAIQGVIHCLKFLKPEETERIERAAGIVAAAGSDCRFLLQVKETAKQVMEVSTTIGAWPQPSRLFVVLTDKATGAYREAPPAEVGFYDDGVLLAGKVKMARGNVALAARASTPARMIADRHGGDLSWHMDDFVETDRPVISALLRFR